MNIYFTDSIKSQIINTLRLASWNRVNIPNYKKYIETEKNQLQQCLNAQSQFLLFDLLNIIVDYAVDLSKLVEDCYMTAKLGNKDFSTIHTYIQYVPEKHDSILYDIWTYTETEYKRVYQSFQYVIEQSKDLLHWCGYVEIPYTHTMYQTTESDIRDRYNIFDTGFQISDVEQSEFINKLYVCGKLDHGHYYINDTGDWDWTNHKFLQFKIIEYYDFDTMEQNLKKVIEYANRGCPYRYCVICCESEAYKTTLIACPLCKQTLYCSENCRLIDTVHVEKCTKFHSL